MGGFSYSDLMALDLTKLGAAATDWKTMAGELAKLATDVRDGLVKKSNAARWQGANATVTREFVGKTAKEFSYLRREAESIASVLGDAHAELTRYQRQAQTLTESAGKGNPSHQPPDPGLLVFDGPNGTVRVSERICTPEGADQRTQDRIRWYGHPHRHRPTCRRGRRGSRTCASQESRKRPAERRPRPVHVLDEEQLPRANELAGLGKDADPQQRAELRRLWESLSPAARAQLWLARKDDLMAAGILSPTMPQVAADAGAGRHGSQPPGFEERATEQKMRLMVEGADWQGMTDASRHMAHYLGNSGSSVTLSVDKMMTDVPSFKSYIDDIVRTNQDDWREQALEEFRKNGGKPVAFPVEAKAPEGFYFSKETDENWFYAVGGANANVTGVVTAVPDAHGNPEIAMDYQANVWDRYNWDEGKGVKIGPMEIPDGQMAKLHRVGLAQEFDMSGSSGVQHYDLGSAAPNTGPLPGPEEGRDGRTNPGREQQQDRTTPEAGRGSDR
ncbi:hypothetical protein QMZ92_35290 [Streptomyces sp. HNM0645]|uniref:hypothetical protein n=1 Tax=Streptomyces sp. HNM0645 TaxID=2782343 RepID=UPI0024B7AD24|nr:hypothetical protein [Streptomyces sp. HNM0645]MDI9889432.1 hypothetical protein [Streptomyces sp. HNM0645]